MKNKRGNKRGFELAISTLVIIVLAILVLIALILAFTVGWGKFLDTIRGYGGSDIDNLNKLCKTQCDFENKYSYCCEEKSLGKEKITCLDEKLEQDCNIDCAGACAS